MICAILFSERVFIPSQHSGGVLFSSFFLFFTQKKWTEWSIFLMQSLNAPPPQFHHELNLGHNVRGDEGEQADQSKDQGGVSGKGKGEKDWR